MNDSPISWRRYALYRPQVERRTVYAGVPYRGETVPGEYGYNHCASIAWFDGRFHVVWDAHHHYHEGQPGQKNLWSTSTDGCEWTPPVEFVDEASVNPVGDADGKQWQPNLLNYRDEELWCWWYLSGSQGGSTGTYLSRLARGASQWEHQKVIDRLPLAHGGAATCFASQNPCLLRSGRVVAPFTAQGAIYEAETYRHPLRERLNGVAYSDDGGRTWETSNLVSKPEDGAGLWEPHVFEQADGRLRMFMVNRSKELLPPTERMLTCVGTGARKGEPVVFEETPQYARVETITSRMQVEPLSSGRFALFHCDVYAEARCNEARQNLALFFSRAGADDFVPGPGILPRGAIAMYPQGIEHEGKLYVVYTRPHDEAFYPENIELAVVDPLPEPDQYYVWPRDREVMTFEPRMEGGKRTPFWRRTNPDYAYAPPEEVEADGRTALLFRERAMASVEIDVPDFEAGERLCVRFEAKIEQLQGIGNLVLCAFGSPQPIRVAMPSYRKGRLHVWTSDGWMEADAFPLGEWTAIDLSFGRGTFTIRCGGGETHTFGNPMPRPGRRLFLGDGLEIDAFESNRGSRFCIDLDSLRTGMDAKR